MYVRICGFGGSMQICFFVFYHIAGIIFSHNYMFNFYLINSCRSASFYYPFVYIFLQYPLTLLLKERKRLKKTTKTGKYRRRNSKIKRNLRTDNKPPFNTHLQHKKWHTFEGLRLIKLIIHLSRIWRTRSWETQTAKMKRMQKKMEECTNVRILWSGSWGGWEKGLDQRKGCFNSDLIWISSPKSSIKVTLYCKDVKEEQHSNKIDISVCKAEDF